MIYTEKFYLAKCDNCGQQAEFWDGVIALNDIQNVKDCLAYSDWYVTVGGHVYCPDCYDFDDNDNLIIKKNKEK